jgi:hypothetical protein
VAALVELPARNPGWLVAARRLNCSQGTGLRRMAGSARVYRRKGLRKKDA